MDIVTLGAALNGSAEYVNSHFKSGSNIQIVDNPDGTQTINASGEVSSEDTVARADIAAIKDGETLDSFGDVETALGDKADADNVYKLALTTDDLLPANTDLDDVKTVGCYYVYESVNVTTITHRPTGNTSAFRVTVELAAGKNRPRQIYQEFNSYNKYVRYETSSGTWANWEKVEGDLSTKQDTISDLSAIRSGAALGATAVQPETGKGLSTNDYTTDEKTKLAGIADGAEVNVQSDWTQTTTTADDYIKNKPTLGTAAAKNATDTYNATGTDVTTGKAVAAALATLPEPMVFKGSLGTGGTITTLPTASSSNKGYVYKVITAGTYASQSAKVGDTFISDGSAWVLIPSGDEPSGTVTNVAVANGGGLTVSGSPITSSGTITVGHSNSVTAETSSSIKKFTYDAHGHVTGSSELSTAESDALASGIDSTKVEQIETNKNNILSIQEEQVVQNREIATLREITNCKLYGYRIDKQDTNPDTRVTYLYDAVGMTPAYMDFSGGSFNYGSWGDIWFIAKNRPVALKYDGTVDYELSHTDFTKKIDGETASDVSDSTYGGNFMSEIPLVYVKRWEDTRYNYVVFCETKPNDDYLAQAHTNANGTVNPYIYLPMFKGSIDANNKLRSLMGTIPNGNTTAANEVSYVENCGNGWQLWDKAKIDLIMDLIVLITKSTNCRGKIGNGDCQTYNASDTRKDSKNNGANGKMMSGYEVGDTTRSTNAQFYGAEGTDSTNYGKHHMIAFYIEDLWANRWDRCLGFNLVDNVYKVKMIPPYALDSDSTYQTLSVTPPSSTEGWLKNVSSGVYGDVPTEVGASNVSGFANYFYKNASGARLSLFGGGAAAGLGVGRYWGLDGGAANSSWHVGGSPCYNAL